jgi:hypothetical protein
LNEPLLVKVPYELHKRCVDKPPEFAASMALLVALSAPQRQRHLPYHQVRQSSQPDAAVVDDGAATGNEPMKLVPEFSA